MSFFLLFYFEYFLLLSSSLLIFPSTTSVINHSQCIFQLRHFSLLLCLGWALCVFSLSLLNIFIFLNIGSSCYHNTFLSLSADSAIYRIFLFAFLIIFNCMAIKIFFFFCISMNTLGFCSGKQLKYLEAMWFFQILLLSFALWSQKRLSRTNFASVLKQKLSKYSTQCSMNYKVFSCGYWVQEIFGGPLWTQSTVLSSPLMLFFLFTLDSFLKCM